MNKPIGGQYTLARLERHWRLTAQRDAVRNLNMRSPGAAAVQSYVLAGRALTHSLRARGPWCTLIFAALGMGLPALAEYRAINVSRILRHHGQPRVKNVPVSVVLS